MTSRSTIKRKNIQSQARTKPTEGLIKPSELKALVKAMREEGVLSLKTPAVELELDQGVSQGNKSASILGHPSELQTPSSDETPAFTDEEILFWSSSEHGQGS